MKILRLTVNGTFLIVLDLRFQRPKKIKYNGTMTTMTMLINITLFVFLAKPQYVTTYN